MPNMPNAYTRPRRGGMSRCFIRLRVPLVTPRRRGEALAATTGGSSMPVLVTQAEDPLRDTAVGFVSARAQETGHERRKAGVRGRGVRRVAPIGAGLRNRENHSTF